MKADEIREEFKIDMNGTPECGPSIETKAIVELAAQVAELNESRKPRWVNINSNGYPCLIDANRVGSVNASKDNGTDCVIITVRGIRDWFKVFDKDHDEIRALLGIDEDWMSPPKPVHGRIVSDADYAEMMEIINTARKLSEDIPLIATSTGTARENFSKLGKLFDSFDGMPF